MKLRYVGNAPFFSALTKPEQERVSERMRLVRHKSGEVLFRRGDDSEALYLIKSGWVRLVANGGPGLANQGSGSLVGETDLFLDQSRSFGAVVASDAEFWALKREDLSDLISESPQVGLKLSQAFGSRLALLNRYLLEQRLKVLPLLAGLDEPILVAIAERLTLVEKAKDEFIVEAGQPAEALFIVEAGQVHLHSPEEGGDVSELIAGESFGELAVLAGKPHSRSAQAATDTVVWAMPTHEFEALAQEYPQLRLALSETIREPLQAKDLSRAVKRLAAMPLFSALPEDILEAVSQRLLLRHVPAGEMVFAKGAPGDALYLIEDGQVEIVSSSGAGGIVLAVLGPDEFFGEMALLTGKPRSTAARSATHANLWVLYRADFDELVSRFPSISLALSRVLSERLAEMDRRFTESHLRGLKLLSALSPSQLEDVGDRLKPVRYRQDEVIIHQGDPGSEMYFIESGRVRVVREAGSRFLVLAELGAGDVFGEMALLTGAPRSATVTALSDLNLWAMDQTDFDYLVSAYPNLGLAISRLLSERLRNTDARFLSHATAAFDEAVEARGVPTRPPVTRRPEPVYEAVAVPRPAPAPEPTVAPRPVVKPKPKPKPKPARARRRAALATLARGRRALEGSVGWFNSLSRAAKVRLAVIAVLLAWLVFIVTPIAVISTLAADDVTNLQGAIAFVHTATPVPTEAVAMTAADTLEQPVMALSEVVEAAVVTTEEEVLAAPVEAALEAPQRAVEVSDEAATALPTAEPPTPTPWIVVVTNTPAPATPTPLPTNTPIPPTATPQPQPQVAAAPVPTATPAEKPQPPRSLDPRLAALNVNIEPAGVRPNQSYWRLIEVRWQNEAEAQGAHSIYVEVLDENGARIVNHPVQIQWASGNLTVFTEEKPPTEYPANFPMYSSLGSYTVTIGGGLPSDRIVGLGLGTPEQPAFNIHTNFLLKFQRVTR